MHRMSRTTSALIEHSPDLVRIEQGLGKISYLISRVRRHQWIRSASGIPVDRAAAVILRRLEESEPLRPSELAAQLEVEAPHVTRQVQLLEDLGYVTRIADAGDRRAHLIGLTRLRAGRGRPDTGGEQISARRRARRLVRGRTARRGRTLEQDGR